VSCSEYIRATLCASRSRYRRLPFGQSTSPFCYTHGRVHASVGEAASLPTVVMSSWVDDWFVPCATSRRRASSSGPSQHRRESPSASPLTPRGISQHGFASQASLHRVVSTVQGAWVDSRHTALPPALVPDTQAYNAFAFSVPEVLPSTFDLQSFSGGLEPYWLWRYGAIVDAACTIQLPDSVTPAGRATLQSSPSTGTFGGCSRAQSKGRIVRDGLGAAGREELGLGDEELEVADVDVRYLVPKPIDHKSLAAAAARNVSRRHYNSRGRSYCEVELQTVISTKHYVIAARSALSTVQQAEAVKRAAILEGGRVGLWRILVGRAFSAKLHGYDYRRGYAGVETATGPSTSLPGSFPDPLVQLCVDEADLRRELKRAAVSARRRLETFGVRLHVAVWRDHDRQFIAAVGDPKEEASLEDDF
jgi:hypothetical protein